MTKFKKRFYTKTDLEGKFTILQILEVDFEKRIVVNVTIAKTDLEKFETKINNYEEVNIPFDNYRDYLKADGYTFIGC